MSLSGLLRTLIVAEVGLVVLSVVGSLLTESLLPEPLRAYVETEFEGDITTREVAMILAAIPLVVLWLVSSIGLFFFWRPARFLYVVTMIFGLLATPFFGPYVDAGLGAMLESAGTIISGVILALVYFSPVKELFGGPTLGGSLNRVAVE
jgi:hypothetical protein